MGMFTALLLANEGIKTRIIDRESRSTTHSYACGLHPRTLPLLDRVGLLDDVLRRGRRIDTAAIYEGTNRHAEVKLSKLPVDFPFLVVLPQSELENLLEQKLRDKVGIGVMWNHRLASLRGEGDKVMVNVDKLGDTATGYGVPHWDRIVVRSLQVEAAFVVGADGHESFVRRALGIDYAQIAEPELFVVYEFNSDAAPESELRIVLDKTTTNVLWPLPKGRCRWSFKWSQADDDGAFPGKDRSAFWGEPASVAERTKEHLRQLLLARAPWFTGSVDDMDWAIDVQFEHRLASRFGQGRCWLVGDAAHQTGPVGMQSMNVGLLEAEVLTGHLHKILRDGAWLDSLDSYSRTFRNEWQHLLGIDAKVQPLESAVTQPLQAPSALLSCLPGSGMELRMMLRQLGFDLK